MTFLDDFSLDEAKFEYTLIDDSLDGMVVMGNAKTTLL